MPAWPELPYEAWKDTYATLHMCMQVVGKVALAVAPPLNHSWGVALQVTARGLSTRLLPCGDRALTLEFDFVDHQLVIRVTDGRLHHLKLESRPVAEFERELLQLLHSIEVPVKIWPVSVELPEPVRLDQDTVHHSYDPEFAARLWQILVRCHRVFEASRAAFIGKASPCHFFWGSFDLALTRFSGRTAPPREGPRFMRDAYSHEVISHGFWPGNAALPEPVFYAYSVPEPAGFREAPMQPRETYYHKDFGEFMLPYAAVRNTADPVKTLRSFIDSTYSQAASLGGWDRARLEQQPAEASA
jgi:hypothetical protein